MFTDGDSIERPLILSAEGRHSSVVLVLLVFRVIEVLEIQEVTLFFATLVTVGPAEIVVERIVVLVTAFGEIVLMLVTMSDVVWVIWVTGVAAVIPLKIVEVVTRVMVFSFGVDVKSKVSVEIRVLTTETVFGVLVWVKISEVTIVEYSVTGIGVMSVDAVTFDVTVFVVVEDEPWIVKVVDITSSRVIVVNFPAGTTVEYDVVVITCVKYL
jgi:hypothetical protein